MGRFDGKVALVTGAASGIGRATAEVLHREGATVYLADIDEAGVEAAAAALGPRATALQLDVSRPQSFEAAYARIATDAGQLDVLVNNAGAPGTPARLEDMDWDGWDATMALLLRSVAVGTKGAVPLMRAAGGGAVVNVSSVAALNAGHGPTAYSVAKAGVLHFTKVAAAELSRYGIRVNAVCPGLILTNIFSATVAADPDALARFPGLPEEIRDYMTRIAPGAQPIGKPGVPEDVAETIAFLAGPGAAFITGAHLLVDGGLLIGPPHSWSAEARRPPDHPLNKLLGTDVRS